MNRQLFAKRIMIMGPCGSGKSTVARTIGQKLKLPVYHMDQLYWNPGWQAGSAEVLSHRLNEITESEEWIIDGNFSRSLESRLRRSDTIIYLDYSTWRCFWRILKRISKYKNQVRPDMAEGCPEKFDLNFMHYVLVWNLQNRKKMMKILAGEEKSKHVVIAKNDRELQNSIDEL